MDVNEGSRDQAEKKRRKSRSPAIYWHLDMATEYLIYAVLVFTPWAFGTTEQWSINSMNALCYLLGLLLVGKWIVKGVTGFRPARWDGPGGLRGVNSMWITGPLFVLTVFMVGYVGISAWNARADYLFAEQRFQYRTSFIP